MAHVEMRFKWNNPVWLAGYLWQVVTAYWIAGRKAAGFRYPIKPVNVHLIKRR